MMNADMLTSVKVLLSEEDMMSMTNLWNEKRVLEMDSSSIRWRTRTIVNYMIMKFSNLIWTNNNGVLFNLTLGWDTKER